MTTNEFESMCDLMNERIVLKARLIVLDKTINEMEKARSDKLMADEKKRRGE